jgi:hypothetical protein
VKEKRKMSMALDTLGAFNTLLDKALREADPDDAGGVIATVDGIVYLFTSGSLKVRQFGKFEDVSGYRGYALQRVFDNAPAIYVQMVDAAESRRTARESEATQMLKSAEKLQRWMAEKKVKG